MLYQEAKATIHPSAGSNSSEIPQLSGSGADSSDFKFQSQCRTDSSSGIANVAAAYADSAIASDAGGIVFAAASGPQPPQAVSKAVGMRAAAYGVCGGAV